MVTVITGALTDVTALVESSSAWRVQFETEATYAPGRLVDSGRSRHLIFTRDRRSSVNDQLSTMPTSRPCAYAASVENSTRRAELLSTSAVTSVSEV